jgi:hypothetical protein
MSNFRLWTGLPNLKGLAICTYVRLIIRPCNGNAVCIVGSRDLSVSLREAKYMAAAVGSGPNCFSSLRAHWEKAPTLSSLLKIGLMRWKVRKTININYHWDVLINSEICAFEMSARIRRRLFKSGKYSWTGITKRRTEKERSILSRACIVCYRS